MAILQTWNYCGDQQGPPGSDANSPMQINEIYITADFQNDVASVFWCSGHNKQMIVSNTSPKSNIPTGDPPPWIAN